MRVFGSAADYVQHDRCREHRRDGRVWEGGHDVEDREKLGFVLGECGAGLDSIVP
jgi:hypothetical protein